LTSKRQTVANRANARRSTGPKSPEGKHAVRLNGLRHGLLSRDVVLDSVAVFYSGGAGYSGPFNGLNSVYSQTTGTTIASCISATCNTVNGDVIQSTILFNTIPNITATGGVNVWFDQTPHFGGLGLQTATGSAGTGDDQIEGNGVLHLHFATPVNITGIATLFDVTDHGPFGSGFNAATVGSMHFLFCASNSSCTPSTSETFGSVNTVGMFTSGLFTDFAFAESSDNVEFYVSALTYHTVPGPIVGAGLPGLTLAAGGLLALARRRRQLVV
jgi:hypothetical protein